MITDSNNLRYWSHYYFHYSVIIFIAVLILCPFVSAAGNSVGTPLFTDPANIGVPDLSLSDNTTSPPRTEYLGMRVDSLTAPSSAVVGGEVAGEVNIINIGINPAYHVQLDFYLSPDREINEDDIWVQRKTTSIHPPGFESVLPYQFVVPAGLTENDYYVGVVVRSYSSGVFIVQDSTLASHTTTISRSTRPKFSSLKPDLAVTSISYLIGNYSPGGPLEITYTLENTGGASNAFPITFYLSRDPEITPSDQFLWSDYYTKGHEHMNLTRASLFRIPESIIPGTYYLGAIVDYQHQTGDINRENNSLSSSIPITIEPAVPIDQNEFNQMVESHIAEKTNIYRSYVGAPPLMHTVELSSLAKLHATDMANRNYFSHYTPEGLSPIDRALALGFPKEKRGEWGVVHEGVAENIVKIHEGNSIGSGYSGFVDGTDPESVATVMLLEWISSPSHHATLIDERLDSFGIGVAKQGSTYYGVVDFF